MTTNEHLDRAIALTKAISTTNNSFDRNRADVALESLSALRAHISELEEKSKSGSPCVRCGAPYLPHGQCSRHAEGCQGGRGESGSPADPPVSPSGSANRDRAVALEVLYDAVAEYVGLRSNYDELAAALDAVPYRGFALPTPPNPGAETEATKGLPDVAGLRAQMEAISEQLEFDRSAVADCLSAANRAIDGRHWLTEGRGPYEWNDDKWHEEFYAAAVEIRGALAPLTKIAANWKDCPQKGEDVAKARIDLQARITALIVERDQARAECMEGHRAFEAVFGESVNGRDFPVKVTIARHRVNALEEALREIAAVEDCLPNCVAYEWAALRTCIGRARAALSTVAPKSNTGSPLIAAESSPKPRKSGAKPPLELEVCIIERSQPFISGVWGNATTGVIEQIEADLADAATDGWLNAVPLEAETVRLTAEWSEPEYGEYGRVDVAGYWDLNIIPMPNPGSAGEEASARKGLPEMRRATPERSEGDPANQESTS